MDQPTSVQSFKVLRNKDLDTIKREGIQYDSTQLHAIDSCLDGSRRIVAVTGEAGTGKTSILRDVYNLFSQRGRKVALCAPTGKAAKRIEEATGIPATTIHRLLEYPKPGQIDEKTGKPLITTEPQRHYRNPLDFDVILADEYAMVNVEVHRNLLDALPNGGLIRMFGDANQLQPIEANNQEKEDSSFLKMLHKFEGITLKKVHRQAEGSSIISNGHKIIAGLMPTRSEDFRMILTEEPVEALSNFVMDCLAEDTDFGSLKNQIISPVKVGWTGTDALNGLLQNMLQPSHKISMELERQKWAKVESLRVFEGDKIIYTVNNYPLEVFNGETGIIQGFSPAGEVIVDFGDRVIAIPPTLEMESRRGVYRINPQKDIELAYAITTHKSQGSEYEKVCYVINHSRAFLLNRKNFYTAISRARHKVMVIASQRALSLSLYKKGD